jgi:phage pi2 protein 07
MTLSNENDIPFADSIKSKRNKKELLLKYLKEQYPNQNTQISKFYEIKKLYKWRIKVPQEFIDFRKSTTNERQLLPKDVIRIEKTDYLELIDYLRDKHVPTKKTKQTEYAGYMLLFLMAVSGRRISEIQQSPFELRRGALVYIPMKKKEKKFCEITDLVRISNEDFIDYLEDFRGYVDINNLSKVAVEKATDRLVKNDPRMTLLRRPHDFRGLYIYYICFYVLPNINDTNFLPNAKNLLCQDSLDATLHYNKFDIYEDLEQNDLEN